jgi:hypothetical protein
MRERTRSSIPLLPFISSSEPCGDHAAGAGELFFFDSKIRVQKCMYRMLGKAGCLCRRPAGSRIQQIAELEYAIDPSNRVDCKITEDRSAISLLMIIFTPKD